MLKGKIRRNQQPTPRQRKAARAIADNILSAKPLPIGQVLKSVGYGTGLQNAPHRVLESEGFKSIIDEYLPEKMLAGRHVELLNATRMEHMVFPLGPEGEDDINFSGGRIKREIVEAEVPEEAKERTTLTDKEIIEMLAEVNCKVRRIVHGETARHVYFWAADNMARDKALDKAYKLRGRYQDDPERPQNPITNTYNFIFNAETQADVKAMEEKIKARLLQKSHVQEN